MMLRLRGQYRLLTGSVDVSEGFGDRMVGERREKDEKKEAGRRRGKGGTEKNKGI